MANNPSSYGEFLREGERFAQGIAANAEELPHLELFREPLQGLLDAVRNLTTQQGVAAAEKQEITRQLREAFLSGTKLLAFMRKGVQQTYGTQGEKLVEFGLVPFRSRLRRPAPAAQPVLPPPVIE